jgi:ATP phosphoribosyltransferase regulatory subunit
MRVEPTVPAEVLAAIWAPLEGVGVVAGDAPLLQPLNLLLDLAGEAMRARLFVVQAEGGAELCLRPDFTVAIARQHLESGCAQARYGYQGAAFRAAGGTDRPEEFVQIGLEALGEDGRTPEAADSEIAELAWRSAAAGGRQDLSLWLALFAAFIDALGLAPALAGRLKRVAGRPRLLQAELARTSAGSSGEEGALSGLLAGLSADRAGALLQEVWSLAGIEPVGGRGPAEIAARLVRKAEAASAPALTEAQAAAVRGFMAIDDAPEPALKTIGNLAHAKSDVLRQALDAWRRRLEALSAAVPADRLRFTPALGHAFDYYDGLVFEVRSAALGADRPVAVGGRYDGLLTRLGGAEASRAVGCMVRPWRAWTGGES